MKRPDMRSRFRAQIDHDIVNRATHATHQLGLARRFCLKMHSAERAGFGIRRQVALDDVWVETMFRKFVGTKGPRKKATLILMPLEVDSEGTAERGLNKNHFGKIALWRHLGRAISPKEILVDLPCTDQVFELFYAGKTGVVKDLGPHIDLLKNIA